MSDIETSSGRFINVRAPVLTVEETAHSLSNLCRFTGHCREFYSVAEHSCLVALIMAGLDLGNPVEGLFHDEHETVTNDLASPCKRDLGDYRYWQKSLDRQMRIRRDLPEYPTEGCKLADMIALRLEAQELMPSRGDGPYWAGAWSTEVLAGTERIREMCNAKIAHGSSRTSIIRCFPPLLARKEFLRAYRRCTI